MSNEVESSESLQDHRLYNNAAMFKALGDERRLKIMHQIAKKPGICSCKVLEAHNMSQSTLSHHMKLLCEAGLVKCQKNGKWVHYTLNSEGIKRATEALRDLLKAAQL